MVIAAVASVAVPSGQALAAPDRTRLVAYGHSWPAGYGVQRAYPERVAERGGLELVNRARSGALSPATAEAVMSRPPRRGDLVIVQTGLNDAIFYGRAGLHVYREHLSKALYEALSRRARVVLVVDDKPAGWPPPRLDIAGTPTVVAAYRAVALEVAHGYGALIVVQADVPPDGWQDDGVHPNARGHRAIAGQVLRAVHRADSDAAGE